MNKCSACMHFSFPSPLMRLFTHFAKRRLTINIAYSQRIFTIKSGSNYLNMLADKMINHYLKVTNFQLYLSENQLRERTDIARDSSTLEDWIAKGNSRMNSRIYFLLPFFKALVLPIDRIGSTFAANSHLHIPFTII